jgi:propanol-preferring alcohol dehydrogenase
MKAMVLHDWVSKWGSNLKLEEVPIPKLAPSDVLVKVNACGVGLSVSNFMMGAIGKNPSLLPKIPGDEITGTVAETGTAVQKFTNGDRVIVYIFVTCDQCKYCVSGRQDLCVNFGGWIGRHLNGGYAEYVKVPSSCLFKLPDDVSFVDGTVINTALAAPVHALESRGQIQLGETVMIIGAAGGVGVHMSQLAKLYGARVIGVDVDDEKLKRTTEFGVDVKINASTSDVPEEVKKTTAGAGADIVVDLVGTPKTLSDALNSLGRAGRFVNLTSHPGIKFEVPSAKLVVEEISITGSRYTTKHEFLKALELVRSRRIKPVISERSTLSDVEKLHVLLAENKLFGRGVMIS